MAAISQTTVFKYILMNEKFWISIEISLKFVLMGLIDSNFFFFFFDSKSALVQVMAWRRTGNKPLP